MRSKWIIFGILVLSLDALTTTTILPPRQQIAAHEPRYVS
jgi:hypothetical protein